VAKFELVFKESVSKDLKDIPKQDVQRIIESINLLKDHPHPAGSVKLSGRKHYRVRQRNYRIIRWTRKIGPEVKLSKWFGGGINKPN